jgi:deoxyribonuclease V
MSGMWPVDADALVAAQHELARATPEPWRPGETGPRVGGCWVCFPRGVSGPGRAGDPVWAAAVVMERGRVVDHALVTGRAGAPYAAGLLALRMGPVMEQAVRRLRAVPEVLFLDASGRDHPRAAGLALHLGEVLGVPTVGVTHRPLVAVGAWPDEERGATSPLRIGEAVVACWMRTRPGTRPLVVHPGWRVDLATAVGLVEAATRRHRTPEPLRRARRLAREARAAEQGQGPSTRSR